MPSAPRPLLLALHAGARPRGASARLLTAFLRGARGWRVVRLSLAGLGVRPCVGCEACRRTGRCWQKDRMPEVLEFARLADALVVSSPVYFYGFPSQAKAVIDRTQPLWHNPPRPAALRRPAAFLATCAGQRQHPFDAIILEAKAFFHTLGFRYTRQLLVPGLERRDTALRLPEAERRAQVLGKNFANAVLRHV